MVEECIIGVHDCPVGIDNAILLNYSVLGMNMAEEMSSQIQRRQFLQYFFGAIEDVMVEVKDSVSRTVSDEYIGIGGDFGIVAALPVGYTIAHEHRDAVEIQSVNLDACVTEIMHIVVEPADSGSIKALVMVAADENFMPIWQVAEPFEKVNCLLLGTHHAEVTGMNHHVSLGQIPQPTMTAVSIRKMKYLH